MAGKQVGEVNPFKQECLGQYGYGTGYRIVHDQMEASLAVATAKALGVTNGEVIIMSFCDRCPKGAECWEASRQRLLEQKPGDCAAFEQALAEGREQGLESGQVSVRLLEKGTPDPYAASMLENLRKGAHDWQTERSGRE
jgi:hypothetical protein